MFKFILKMFEAVPPVVTGTYERRKVLFEKAVEEAKKEPIPDLAVILGYKKDEKELTA